MHGEVCELITAQYRRGIGYGTLQGVTKKKGRGEGERRDGGLRGNFISCDIMHAAEVMLDEVW